MPQLRWVIWLNVRLRQWKPQELNVDLIYKRAKQATVSDVNETQDRLIDLLLTIMNCNDCYKSAYKQCV